MRKLVVARYTMKTNWPSILINSLSFLFLTILFFLNFLLFHLCIVLFFIDFQTVSIFVLISSSPLVKINFHIFSSNFLVFIKLSTNQTHLTDQLLKILLNVAGFGVRILKPYGMSLVESAHQPSYIPILKTFNRIISP